MLENSERYPLTSILLEDLFSANKSIAVLLILVVVSALGTILVTHQTRTLIAEKNQLMDRNQMLEHTFLHLTLEDHGSIGAKDRIKKIATDNLKMKQIDEGQEVVIFE